MARKMRVQKNNKKTQLKREKKSNLMRKLKRLEMMLKSMKFKADGKSKFLMSTSVTSWALSLYIVNSRSLFLSSQ